MHDVSAMQIGETLRWPRWRRPEGVSLLDDLEETVLATLSPPRLQSEESTEIEAETELVGEAEEASARRLRGRIRRGIGPARPFGGGGAPIDWLIVGLGNPGARVRAARRTTSGFMVAEALAERWELGAPEDALPRALRGGARRMRVTRRPARAAPTRGAAVPQTYMNEAGRSVGPARGSYKLALERVLVVHDEIDLPFGEVRTRLGGGLAGHNGLKSLKRELGGADFMRVRVGVGRPTRTDPEIVSALRARPLPAAARRRFAELVERALRGRSSGVRVGAARVDALALRSLLGLSGGRVGAAARARGRPRVRLRVAAAVPDRGAGRHRRRGARARPTLVVVGDDRAARDLAGDLRAWLAPRRVRYYPSRGVAYESHLAPAGASGGPARGGARCAAGAARGGRQPSPPVVVVSAVALSEKVPDPALRPHSFTLRVGELLDLDECAGELVAAGYERVDQVEERGQFALRGGLLDVFPATEERAVRVDMFDVEIESLRWFSTFTQRSLGDVRGGRDRARGGARGRAPRAGRDRRPGVRSARAGRLGAGHRRAAAGRALRRAARPVRRATRSCVVAAEEELAPALSDHWSDVCAAFDDEDAHHLYVSPEQIEAALARARADLAVSALRRPGDRAARAVRGHGGALAGAKPSRSSRSSCARATARSSRSRGAARASARRTTSGA